MAERFPIFTVSMPAGVPIATPTTQDVTFDDGDVERIEITVPPGPSGLMGFQVLFSGEPVIPHRGTTWVITDNEHINWPIDGFPTSGRWQVRFYNTDIYPHDVHFRFLVNETRRSEPTNIIPLLIVQPDQEVVSVE